MVDAALMPFRQSEDRKWKRPYPIGWFHALGGLFGVLGVVFFVALVVSGITRVGTRPGAAALELAIGIAFFGVWFTFCWRLLTVGIYVGNRGLQYQVTIKTTTIPRDDVRGVRKWFGGLIQQEACLRNHLYHAGRRWDQMVSAVYRGEYERR